MVTLSLLAASCSVVASASQAVVWLEPAACLVHDAVELDVSSYLHADNC